MTTKTIRRELKFPQSPAAVWRALATREALADWMYPNDFEPRVGHRFTFRVPPNPQARFDGLTVHCEVLRCAPPSELEFTWVVGDGFLDTRVSYRIEPDGSGTRVLFEHSGFKQDQAFHGAEYGWTMMHGKLTQALEKASDSAALPSPVSDNPALKA
jgi:uncharacterized protein YndB with AHSA1/START domain